MARQTKASARISVLRILNAARATMTPEEQKILDRIVIFKEPDEVIAHAMQTKATATKSSTTKASATKAAATKTQPINIMFDSETGEYKFID